MYQESIFYFICHSGDFSTAILRLLARVFPEKSFRPVRPRINPFPLYIYIYINPGIITVLCVATVATHFHLETRRKIKGGTAECIFSRTNPRHSRHIYKTDKIGGSAPPIRLPLEGVVIHKAGLSPCNSVI
jgi:hypothetical protein